MLVRPVHAIAKSVDTAKSMAGDGWVNEGITKSGITMEVHTFHTNFH
jgi:hypothetical protein